MEYKIFGDNIDASKNGINCSEQFGLEGNLFEGFYGVVINTRIDITESNLNSFIRSNYIPCYPILLPTAKDNEFTLRISFKFSNDNRVNSVIFYALKILNYPGLSLSSIINSTDTMKNNKLYKIFVRLGCDDNDSSYFTSDVIQVLDFPDLIIRCAIKPIDSQLEQLSHYTDTNLGQLSISELGKHDYEHLISKSSGEYYYSNLLSNIKDPVHPIKTINGFYKI